MIEHDRRVCSACQFAPFRERSLRQGEPRFGCVNRTSCQLANVTLPDGFKSMIRFICTKEHGSSRRAPSPAQQMCSCHIMYARCARPVEVRRSVCSKLPKCTEQIQAIYSLGGGVLRASVEDFACHSALGFFPLRWPPNRLKGLGRFSLPFLRVIFLWKVD